MSMRALLLPACAWAKLIAQEDPNVFIFTGDNVCSGGQCHKLPLSCSQDINDSVLNRRLSYTMQDTYPSTPARYLRLSASYTAAARAS